MATLSVSTWGDPNAVKRVLLIHGLTSSSQSWYRIAQDFATRGFFVTAPDLLGHGNARRSSDYTIAALVDELRPLFATAGGNDHPYHIVIGHSLGGLVAAALLPLLTSTRTVHVVLVDPPFEASPDPSARGDYKQFLRDAIKNPKTPEAYLQDFPLWTKEDAIFRSLSVRLCDIPTVDAILDQNKPWSYSHLLSVVPDNVKVTVLIADPSKMPCTREEHLKPYPHVVAKVVWGASHLIQVELPHVVVETALEGVQSQN